MSISAAKRTLYRKRTGRSLCRRKTAKPCRRLKGCKMTKGSAKRAPYCRKSRTHKVYA